MFAEKAQSLVNQLAPVWKVEHADNYSRAHDEITGLLTRLSEEIPNLRPQEEIQNLVSRVTSVLEKEFRGSGEGLQSLAAGQLPRGAHLVTLETPSGRLARLIPNY
jgi:hypothetical protein